MGDRVPGASKGTAEPVGHHARHTTTPVSDMEKQKQSATHPTPIPKPAEVKPVKDVVASKPEPEPVEPPRGHPLLFLLGAVAVVVGGALTVLPAVMPDQASLVGSFAKHGITGMPLALTGVLLCALAIVTRKQPDTQAQKQNADQLLVLEQVASDLIVTRGLIQDLRIEFVYLKDQVQTAISRDEQEAQTSTTDAHAAMFRLAGSMDQLTGRLETRLGTLDTAVNEQFGQVRSELGDVRNYVDGLRAKVEEAIHSSPTHARDTYHVTDERQIEIEQGYESHEDDLSVQVLLDEEASQSLGLLDEFDEHGRHNSQKQSPSNRPTRRATDLDSQAGLLPSRSTGRRRMDVEEKIATLRELMADPNVRNALEAARRHT